LKYPKQKHVNVCVLKIVSIEITLLSSLVETEKNKTFNQIEASCQYNQCWFFLKRMEQEFRTLLNQFYLLGIPNAKTTVIWKCRHVGNIFKSKNTQLNFVIL